jgi:hypothetical protein
MFLGLKPLEFVYLAIAIVIVGQQLVVRGGQFDPIAFAAIAFFIGLIPVGRADRKKNSEESRPPSAQVGDTLQDMLRPKKGDEE